jgi:uncharacterized protein (DUF1330 family)
VRKLVHAIAEPFPPGRTVDQLAGAALPMIQDCGHRLLSSRKRQVRAHASEDTTMPAYWVARSKINDPIEYKKYTDLVPGIIAKFGGKVLARGGRYQIMEGPAKFQRFVVIEFPSFEQGVACFTSPEYDRAAAFRRNGAGEVETIILEGGDSTR